MKTFLLICKVMKGTKGEKFLHVSTQLSAFMYDDKYLREMLIGRLKARLPEYYHENALP
jgi:hypothetical protein